MADRTPRRARGHTRIFVYGSLRAGLHNHGVLAGARFIGLDRTPPRYTMFDLRSFPAVCAGGRTAIVGEIYDVDAATLARLDRLEGHPVFYERTRVVLASHRHAHLYLMPWLRLGDRQPMANGDWLAHRAAVSGSHRGDMR